MTISSPMISLVVDEAMFFWSYLSIIGHIHGRYCIRFGRPPRQTCVNT